MLILLLLFLPSASAFLFGQSNSCGCAPCAPAPLPTCPPPPICQPVQQCQPVAPPPPAPCCATCACGRKKRDTEIEGNAISVDSDSFNRKRRDVLDDVIKIDAKCNNELLRDIIIQNIDRATPVAKKKIQAEAERQLSARYNVICARGDFSYITNTEVFCQETVGDVTCYAFKQLSDSARARLL